MAKTAVPLLDLKLQYQAIKSEIDAALLRVVESQHFILGPEVEALEQEVADYCQARYCVGLSSGTDALLAALMAFEIGPGDEVITTSYSFFATAGSIARVGAKPVFADIEFDTFNIDASQIEALITPRTRAIMPVHLYGRCADMTAILAIADKHHLPIIEDAAQAIGAEHRGQRAGSMGAIGCFSFFPSKNLGGFGDGGAVTTNDSDLYEKLKRLRNHGGKTEYVHDIVGGNFRLDAIQAAILRVKLKYLDHWTARRAENAACYSAQLLKTGLVGHSVALPAPSDDRHIFNQYVVRTNNRDELRQYLTEQGISTKVYYPTPLHRQQCFGHLGYAAGSLPESERAARESLALPIYPELTPAQIDLVVAAMRDYYHRAGRARAKQAA